MIPTIEEVEQYLESIEELLSSSLTAATTELPDIRQAINKLWLDISRYGPEIPSFPEVRLPVGDFKVPPEPPRPPPTFLERVGERKVAIAAAVGILAGCGALYAASRSQKKRIRAKAVATERRKVVLVLGGDTPLGLPLITELQKTYIVVTSAANVERAEFIEQACPFGYVRALVLDPSEPSSIAPFLRSLSSTLTRRFPLAAGDPHASLNQQPYIHSLISLLSLSDASDLSPIGPLEHISLQSSYLPYLNATHITPLTVIQAILPLFRLYRGSDRHKTIVVCLPVAAARIGVPFASAQAMSAAATMRGLEVLRRELAVAAATGQEHAEGLKNVDIFTVDVGMFDAPKAPEPHDMLRAMEDWTPSEKLTYGPGFVALGTTPRPVVRSYWAAFSSMLRGEQAIGVPRKPTDVSVFVKTMIGIVSRDSHTNPFWRMLRRIRNITKNRRVVVGAGATTYALASHLPSILLDALLRLPHVLIGLRNALLPSQPFVLPPSRPVSPGFDSLSDPASDPEVGYEADTADVESSTAGDDVGQSWVMPQPGQNY